MEQDSNQGGLGQGAAGGGTGGTGSSDIIAAGGRDAGASSDIVAAGGLNARGSSDAAGASGSLGSGGGLGGGTDDDFEAADTSYYKRHHAAAGGTTSYDEARTGYQAGHRAAANPTYTGRDFNEVEVEIRRDYGEDREGRFERVRGYAAHAFDWKTILGGIALVAGGWWAGRKLYDSLRDLGHEDEQDCRTFYESHTARSTGVPYDRARTVYVVGYAASRNPEYAGRSFDDVEPHLRGGFTGSRAESYDSLRDFARRGYERGSTRGGTL